MVRLFVTMLIAGSVVTGCKNKNSKDSGTAPAGCNISNGQVAPLLAQKTESLAPGIYLYVKSDHLRSSNGVSLVANHTIEASRESLGVICPGVAEASKVYSAFQGQQLEFEMPERLILNLQGEIELMDQYRVLRQTSKVHASHFEHRTSARGTTLAREGLAKDALQKSPGRKITPVKDGVIITLNNGQTQAHYRFERHYAPRPTPRTDRELIKRECLEKTGFKLGRYSPDLIEFSQDCTEVTLVAGSPIPTIRRVTLAGTEGGNCTAATTAEVIMNIFSNFINVRQELSLINPGVRITSQDNAMRIVYTRDSGKNRMLVPTGREFPNGQGEHEFRGDTGAIITLSNETSCRLWSDLRNYEQRVSQDHLWREFVNEFKIQFSPVR